jgi:hypothetical protein
MATLQSPGVSVSVIDESFYTPAGAGTVPMIFVATGQDKANAAGTGIAQGTTAANAGKVWVITSQRDLSDTFGVPYFETDSSGNSVHGSELNEYGLQAAYSALGVSSKAYVVRADLNTSELAPNATVPGGTPVNGTYWAVTSNTDFGINEWNASTKRFTTITPLMIDDTNVEADFDHQASNPGSGTQGLPRTAFGTVGDYAVLVTSDNGTLHPEGVYYKSAANGWVHVNDGFDGGKKVRLSPHFDYPNFTNTGPGALNAASGSIWVKTTAPGNGANWDIRKYNASTDNWDRVNAPLYANTQAALADLDGVGGGANIALGSVFVQYDPQETDMADFRTWIRYKSGPTSVSVASATTATSSWAFDIVGTDEFGNLATTATISGVASSVPLVQTIAEQINNNPTLRYIQATHNTVTNKLTITHSLGGDIYFANTNGQPLVDIGFVGGNIPAIEGSIAHLYTYFGAYWDVFASNWKPLVYEARETAPTTAPDDNQIWFDSDLSADIMYNDGLQWVGYLNAFPGSDQAGPTISATRPTTQQDGVTSLVDGDLWIDTSDPDRYGRNIYVYSAGSWVLADVTDQSSPDGWVFEDARWATSGESDQRSEIADLLLSDYVDPDCPDPRLYPRGTRLFNTRRSGNNVKKYFANYIDPEVENTRYNDEGMAGYFLGRWVSISPNAEDGAGQFGRLAQRSVVVKALKASITENTTIRDTDTLVFNLITTPGYPELIQNMVAFNIDRGLTAFVIGDTPFRLPATGTALTNYGMNTAQAVDNNDIAAVTYDTSLAMFYPSGFTNDNIGNNIVVPPSHVMLRTILNSDNKSYLWFAPAGTRRGVVDNVSSVGFITGEGEFQTASLHQGLRDVCASVKINPIATIPGVGIVNMGQYTRASVASALDRINVSRLIAHLRRQLSILAKPYLFEPNDSQTRQEIKAACDALMTELVSQRALYDFLVVCDSTNNTPARIDRSELWVDIAIEPVKAVEFIYIPLRILNTGEISA